MRLSLVELELYLGDSWDGTIHVHRSNEGQEEACMDLYLEGRDGIGGRDVCKCIAPHSLGLRSVISDVSFEGKANVLT